MSELEKLTSVFDELQIDYTIRRNDSYAYLFLGKPESAKLVSWPPDNFETTDLDTLLRRNNFFEFEDDSLVSWSA